LASHSHNNLTLALNPIVFSHITKGWLFSIARKWKRKYKVNLKLQSNSNYNIVEYHFFDQNEEEIKF